MECICVVVVREYSISKPIQYSISISGDRLSLKALLSDADGFVSLVMINHSNGRWNSSVGHYA